MKKKIMNETDQRLMELENRVDKLQSLSGGILKLLFLSLAYHTQNDSLTEAQRATIKEKITNFLDEPALLEIMSSTEYAEEIKDIAGTMELA